MKIAVLGIIKDPRSGDILLAEKKGVEEIGEGMLTGPGGKIVPPETPEECLHRETLEEWKLELEMHSIRQVALIDFYAAGAVDFRVHILTAHVASGTPCETEIFKMPKWYPPSGIPFDRTYEGDRFWLPKVLAGEKFRANVYYLDRAKNLDPNRPPEFFPFEH